MKDILKSYLKDINDAALKGDAREESYYSCLERLLKDYIDKIPLSRSLSITTLPKKTEAGNPDFRLWDGKQHIIGYIEAKAPDIENLSGIEQSDQLKRYLQTFPNLILTNFFEFRLYRDGRLIDKVQIARPFIVHKLKTIPPVEKEIEFLRLLEKFFSFSMPKVYDAKNLAIELAKRTRFLKDEVISQELKEEEKAGKGFIRGFYKVFKDYLISGLTEEDFADLYSQTITYGLFAARTRSENGFNRKLAYDNIPQTIGILRDIFEFISLGKLPKQMEWIVDDISEVLAVTDVYKILDTYFHQHKGKDPIVHFYETFLAEYDPKTREKRGVYYTPEPVVSYIVRSLNRILKEHFKKQDGFANTSVTVLDPAAGTLTFLAEAAKLAVDEFITRYGEGAKENFIKEHILKNFYAFELMMAPYAIGHLKISFLLEELGYKFCEDDRFNLYLTNTLEMEELGETLLPGMASLSEESHLAGEVKKQKPILVILGNPPYSGHSSNIGDWISKEIRTYYQVDGKPLGEKNPKWLQDDYVKFIRFAQWKIDQAGEGVLGFITNHSYLDNPTFRGMRQSLMATFDEIYILDLHGNSLKKEKCPDGNKDENVFDIQQGVAIALFVKKKGGNSVIPAGRKSFLKKDAGQAGMTTKKECKVLHSEIWGIREDKYDWLNKHNIETTKWQTIKPKSEFYLFIPRDERLLSLYETYPKITDIFPVNSVGIVTARDDFAIDYDKDALKRRVRQFINKSLPDEVIRQAFGVNDTSKFKLTDVRKKVINDDEWEQAITKILYRPFDERWIFYYDAVIERTRKEVMQHMMQENLGLITSRIVKDQQYFHAFISMIITDASLLATNTASSSYLFPLYLYQQKEKPKKRSLSSIMMLFEPSAEYGVKKPNLSPSFVEKLTNIYTPHIPPYQGGTEGGVSPEQIFYYIYAVLYSSIYRTKYAEFLKIDFPRIPFTIDYKLFSKMAEYGDELVQLHLLKSPVTSPSDSSEKQTTTLPPLTKSKQPPQSPFITGELKGGVKFQGQGDNSVEKLKYELFEKSPPSPLCQRGVSEQSPPLKKGDIGGFGVVYINNTQYFEGIPQEVWEYQIGGYRVCEKWLKDRKGRTLSLNEIVHYCKIVTAIEQTIKIQKDIDGIFGNVEETILG